MSKFNQKLQEHGYVPLEQLIEENYPMAFGITTILAEVLGNMAMHVSIIGYTLTLTKPPIPNSDLDKAFEHMSRKWKNLAPGEKGFYLKNDPVYTLETYMAEEGEELESIMKTAMIAVKKYIDIHE